MSTRNTITIPERLELVWVGKHTNALNRPEPRILIEDREKSYGAAEAENMLIHGDNLLALKALEQDFIGKIKCVYIDPPYNTGAAFEHYDDGIEHSLWLSMMRDRLEILWTLVSNDGGSLWISIDDSEMHYLRVLLDEICGRPSFVACNIWQKRYSRENREAIGDSHEYVMVYAKDLKFFKNIRNKLPLGPKQLAVYKNPNNDPNGPWRAVSLSAQGFRPNQMYEIISPITGKKHLPPAGSCWKVIRPVYDQLLSEGRIYFGKSGDSVPSRIQYLKDIKGITPWTWWPHEETGHTDEAKKEIYALFGADDSFDTPKPERLIERIIHIATDQGDTVLDSFLGSGTTAAVAHKMGRRWIGVELGEHCYTHCLPRLQKVVEGLDQGGISKALGWQGGGGFKFYELAPSLLKQDSYGQWVIDKAYNADMLAAAMAKHMGFRYCPDEAVYWKQGRSTETDYIFTTTNFLTVEMLDHIHDEIKAEETLLICCSGFQEAAESRYVNINLSKIPNLILGRCEFGRDDYSLSIINMPRDPDEPEFVPSGPVSVAEDEEPEESEQEAQVRLF